MAQDDMIRSNDLVTDDRAKAILLGLEWYQGDGSAYTKTRGACLEHPAVADIALALEKLNMHGWAASKDIDNNVTISVRGADLETLENLGVIAEKNPKLAGSSRQQTSDITSARGF